MSAFGQKGGHSAFEQTNRSILLTILPFETIFSGLEFDAKPVSDGIGVVKSCRLCVKPPRSAYFAISLFQELKMSIKNAVKLIEESEARFVDLRFTDTKGKQHHFTVPARIVLEDPEEWFENGPAFDGSSIGGWKG
ncbi:TPA: glutamine synthetase beta-grasp domain-containing protein, partial [Neisseria gonorrhoeae]